CGDAAHRVDELTLSDGIALRDPADLPFSDCMHRLVTIDRPGRSLRRTEAEARRDPLLDESMVLFDNIVSVRRFSATTAGAESSGLLQFSNRAGIGRMAIDVDDPRRWSTSG